MHTRSLNDLRSWHIDYWTYELEKLTETWRDLTKISESQKADCREIGEKLDKLGGKVIMEYAYDKVTSNNHAAIVISAYWDGIGDWRWSDG